MTTKIFYSGGREYDGEGKPPARDVQIILQEDDKGPYLQSGSHYYIKRDGRWLGVDQYGLFDWLLDSDFYNYIVPKHHMLIDGEWRELKDDFELYFWLAEKGLVLFGRTITNKEYQSILQKAKIERDSWRRWERRP